MEETPEIHWKEKGETRTAHWHSSRGALPPKRVVVGNDSMNADSAYRLACEGTGILWRGDFQNARLLLQAMARRADAGKVKAGATPAETFHLYRQAQSQRARTLGMLLIPFEADHRVPLRRAPDVGEACAEALGAAGGRYIASLRDLLGMIGAHEWRRRGVDIPEIGGRIHPYYGVFAPVRNEYVGLVARAPLPAGPLAFDIGTGTGVLAALLARRGIARVVAADSDPRAVACARENISRLGLEAQVEVVQAGLFPEGRAALVVCNPPWIPARPATPLEHAVYDEGGGMLRGFLGGLADHLASPGEGWLILSDIAEHLGLRTREELLAAFDAAGLVVVDRLEARPAHPRAAEASDPLHAARAAEVTSLWRLALRRAP